MIERLSFWIAFNTVILKVSYVPLLAITGVFFSFITIIKTFYLGKVVVELCNDLSSEKVIPEQSGFMDLGESKLGSQNQSVDE